MARNKSFSPFFKKLLISYMVLSVVLTIVSCLSFARNKSIVVRNVDSLFSTSLSMFSHTADNNISNVLSACNAVEGLLYFYSDMDFSDRDATNNFRRAIAPLTDTGYIEQIYIYSPSDNLVVSKSGAFEPRVWYYSNYNTPANTYETWVGALSGVYAGNFRFTDATNSSYVNTKCIEYVKTVPYNRKNINIVFLMTANKFFNYVEKNSNMVVRSGDTSFAIRDMYKDIVSSAGEGGTAVKYGRDKYTLAVEESNVSDFKYVQVQPSAIMNSTIHQFYMHLLLNLIICLSLGLLLACMYAKINYKPVAQLFSSMPHFYRNNSPDEFSSVINLINQLLRENKDYINSNVNITYNLQQSATKQLLEGSIKTAAELDKLLHGSGISFTKGGFFVAIFNIVNISQGSTMTEKDIFYLIINVMKDVFSGSEFITAEDGNMLLCILNTDSDRDELESGVEYICQLFSESFATEIAAVLSERQSTALELALCCRRCKEQIFRSSKRFNMLFSDTDSTDEHYSYSQTNEQRLCDYLERGDTDCAKKYIAVTLVKGFYYSVPAEVTKNLLYRMLSVIAPYAQKNAADMAGDFAALDSVDKMIEMVYAELDTVTSENPAHSAESAIAASVVDYVAKNYPDINLSVDYIGQAFEKTPSYISKFFKNEYDINLYEYIQIYRINTAVRLLNATTESVKSISEITGFSNSNIFIRTFKKYIGTTPNQYRKN